LVVGEAIAEVLPLVYPVDPAEARVEVADSVDPKSIDLVESEAISPA
jgi:hypothetical protein